MKMTKKKWFIVIIALIIFIATLYFAFGRECQSIEDLSSSCEIMKQTVNFSSPNQIITTANCNITIINDAGTTINNQTTMGSNLKGYGWHNYTFTPVTSGVFKLDVLCDAGGVYSRDFELITVGTSDQTYLSSITTQITNVNTSINNNVDAVALDVWTYSNRNITTQSEFTSRIWNFTARSLTQSITASLSQSDINAVAVATVNMTVNSTFPGNPQGIGTRIYYIEVLP